MDSRPDFFSKREVFGLDWSLGCLICSENLEEKEKSFNNYFGSFLPHAHTLVHIHAPPHTHTHTRTYTYAQPNASACTCSLSPSLIHLVMKFLAWTSDTKAEAPPAQQEISAASQFNRNWKIPQMSMENWSTRDGLKSLSWVKLSQAKASWTGAVTEMKPVSYKHNWRCHIKWELTITALQELASFVVWPTLITLAIDIKKCQIWKA